METSLIDLTKSYITPDVIQKASTLVGESPMSTRRALETATPAIVAGLAGQASSTSGAGVLMRVLDEADLTGAISGLTDRFAARSGEDLAKQGKELLGRIFGGRLTTMVDATASSSGVKVSTMSSLMGFATPLVLGVLGRQIQTRHLDSAGLAEMLEEEKGAAVSALPRGVAAALGGAPPARVEAPREVSRTGPSESLARFWPALLVLPLLLLWAVLGRQREARVTGEQVPGETNVGAPSKPALTPPIVTEHPAPAEVRAPAPPALETFGAGTIGYEIAQFLGSGGDPSKRFALDDVTFDLASTNMAPGALAKLDSAAAALKAYPASRVLIEGHTDATGAPTANERLSLDRADAVKNALVARGVAADRITTRGFAQERPVAPNDSAAGRARNRRTELIVTR
jgi:outer membrane protein OmpA-like peptidoglycan-associated protein